MRRLFSVLKPRAAVVLEKIATGKTVTLPTTTECPLRPADIHCHGEELLSLNFPSYEVQQNAALDHYRKLRNTLMLFKGKWLATTPTGDFIVAEYQQAARKLIASLAQSTDYYLNCIGCEYAYHGVIDVQKVTMTPAF